MVVAQLVERPLPTLEVRGSNPVTGEFYWQDQIKEKSSFKKNKSLISLQHRNRLEQADRVPLSSRRLRQVKRRRLERRRFRRHPPRPRREDGGR